MGAFPFFLIARKQHHDKFVMSDMWKVDNGQEMDLMLQLQFIETILPIKKSLTS